MEVERLKELFAKVVKEERREDENTRRQSLEQFKEWILKNPDIQGCKTDDAFLLRFLRFKKFSVPLAEECLVNFLSFRQNFREIVEDIDITTNKDLDGVITDGFSFVSPFRDDHGRLVLINVTKNYHTKKYHWKTFLKALLLTFSYLMDEETSQVLGVTAISDMSNNDPSIYTYIPTKVMYNMLANVQKCSPLLMKEIHFLNLLPLGMFFMERFVGWLPKKIQERVKFSKNNEELMTKINPRTLPKEMGGSMPMDEMIDIWRKKLLERRESILSLNKIQLVGNTFKVKEDMDALGGIAGSFKTLEID